jgi:uncharacterized protein (TIGR02001 family)
LNRSSLCGLVAVALTGTAAQANEVSLSFGATIASEYVSNGIRFSDGPVVQPYVELGFGGFYAGAYASNIDADLTGADIEYGLSLGYRGEAGSLSFDAGIAYYLYDEAFPGFPVEDYAEAYASGTLAVTETVYVTASAAIAPEYDQTNLSLRADYYTAVEGLSVGAIVGRLEANYGAWTYWSVDATYAVAEQVSVGIGYHDTNVDPALGLFDTDGLFVASVSIAF